MKPVSSQPLLCVLLFVAGCLCFLAGLNSSWLTDEFRDSGPSGGGRLPGLEPRKQVEDPETPDTQAEPLKADKKDAVDPEHPERKAGETRGAAEHGSGGGTR